MGSELEQALETLDSEQILDALGIDLTDADARKGAIDAINAILDSRKPPMKLDLGMDLGGSQDVDIDPDLIQPSAKFDAEESDADIEIQDDENILSQVKRNESEDDLDTGSQNSANNNSGNDGNGTEDTEGAEDSDNGGQDESNTSESEEPSSGDSSSSDSGSSSANSGAKRGDTDDTQQSDRITKNTDAAADEDPEDAVNSEEDNDTGTVTNDADEPMCTDDITTEGGEVGDDGDIADGSEDEFEDEDFEFDESELLDSENGEYQNITDKEVSDKTKARILKRQRTLNAAKDALAKAVQNKASASLISELEKSIAALEELTEAIDLSMRSMSDDAFNQRINRVLDAIEALGDSGLIFSTDEERQLQAKEIKQDIEATKHELSREDAEQIRAERQGIKAREKEAARYSTRSRNSFKGFQDFLNNLYRAVALQVKTIEVRNDTWSAISRRNSGEGVLRQGQRIEELPETKIPVIDFYFDQSSSWDSKELSFGKKAVQALADMEAKGQIKVNVYYFANKVSANPDDYIGGGTSGWNEIVKNIIQTKATNVVIMTDSDMEDWWEGDTALKYTVPGYVWYLWKNGINAPRLPRDLNGRAGTQQFAFNCR